ncbi:zinc finger BED domain-containing protein 1-like [Scaptodrosophila lebanonensis]|uniref:Zinc finger BED domain-containing protein 1-like n=1 Tax=Drosophila lebanonensis TaxID=7225 RepID=A0A6J2U6I9_DROLE|nr:zinc finger BED domain-containing protein 1-like [Scaptodrosophila lebanonensis]
MDKFLKSGNIKEVDESVEQSGKRKGRQKSDIWNFFTRVPGGNSAKCKTCGLDYRTGGNTTNLFIHLLRAHTTLSHESKPVATIKTFFSSNNYYENYSAHKKELDKALTRMIAIDMQPFRIVEDRGFRDFVHYLNPRYIFPSRTTLRNEHLQNMYNEMKEKLVLILNNVEYCAVTTDGWTSRANEFYVTVTCHFIDKNFVLREAVLSTNKLDIDTDHTSNNIADSLRAVLLDWNILHITSTIVTDNAANMIKACEILKKRHLPCFVHSLNLVIQDVLARDFITGTLSRCKRIVTFFKSSSIAYA